MENKLAPYECQFSAEERKELISESLVQFRKREGYSQKEIASQIGVSQATYSAYERGRNEPPAEILVRLSYLYHCPLDVLVQRERTAKTRGDAQQQIDELKQQIAEFEKAQAEIPEGLKGLMGDLSALLGEVEKLNNSGK